MRTYYVLALWLSQFHLSFMIVAEVDNAICTCTSFKTGTIDCILLEGTLYVYVQCTLAESKDLHLFPAYVYVYSLPIGLSFVRLGQPH